MPEPFVRPGRLRDVLVVEPVPIVDDRGFFVRTLDAETLRAAGVEPADFVQENQSRSRRGTLRGLHGRARLDDAKLVRCPHGTAFEVIADLRPWSETYGEWESVVLDDVDHRQVYVPPGCVHGFLALADVVDICYKHDARYEPDVEIAVRWDDADLAIDWPEEPRVLSDRDRGAASLREVRGELERWYGSSPPGGARG